MNKKIIIMLVLVAVCATTSVYTFDYIDARELQIESDKPSHVHTIGPVEEFTYLKAGETVPIQFQVWADEDVNLSVKVFQSDEIGEEGTTETNPVQWYDLNVTIDDLGFFDKHFEKTTDEDFHILEGKVTSSPNPVDGKVHQVIHSRK